ncbi:MAG: exonuclease SbcCD subunit D C-terminal domain-containing protein [Opitutaceae bacterium]|nr:exonuclease SbcCD subunit D C-terminal domain-containing protein [Opitutaceae bacterium]
MKILHTADWHLGQRFFAKDRLDEHELFLSFLLDTIKRESIDLLILAGDIFDTANPPRPAETLYYNFLRGLVNLKRCQAIIVGGNHDSAPHLNATANYLEADGIHVVGALPENPEDAFFEFDECCVAAVPYLRDRDVRKAIVGESIDDLEARAKAGILNCYAEMGILADLRRSGRPVIATGHLTAVGGSLSESERTIHIGNLGSISAAQFPNVFDYVALGHLHLPQAVGDIDSIRYSGSPIPLSFGEAKTQKQVRVIEVVDGILTHHPVEIPVFRRLLRLQGDTDALLKQLAELVVSEDEPEPWLELTVKDGELLGSANEDLRTAAAEKGMIVLKVLAAAGSRSMGDLLDNGSDVDIGEMKPEDVFGRRLESYDGDVQVGVLEQCFQSLLTEVQEGGEA